VSKKRSRTICLTRKRGLCCGNVSVWPSVRLSVTRRYYV